MRFLNTDIVVHDIFYFVEILSTKPADDFPALQLAQDFYEDCMSSSLGSSSDKVNSFKKDKDIYKVMLNMINLHGGWPLLQEPGSWNGANFDLTQSMVTMKKHFGSPIFLDVTSIQDPLGKKVNNSIYVSPPSPSGSLTSNFIDDAEIRAFKTVFALRDFIVDVSKELLIFQGKRNINTTYLEAKAWEIILVEGKLHGAAERNINTLIFRLVNGISPFSVKTNPYQLQSWLDAYTYPYDNSVKIGKFIQLLYDPIFNHRITRPIEVFSMDYVLAVSKLVSELKDEVLANYVMFKMVTNMIPFTTQRMQEHFNKLKRSLSGTSGERPRKEICTALTQDKFSLAVGHAYVQQTIFNDMATVSLLF